MAVDLGDAAAAAANLALKMGATAADAIVFMAEVGDKLPFLEPVLGTIKAIREKVKTVEKNREELAALEERCTYITACVVEKHSRNPTSEMDVTPLKTCVEAVKAFVELCGSSSRRARFKRWVKAFEDEDEIDGLNARVDRLTSDLGLVGIVIVANKVDNLTTILVSSYSMYLPGTLLIGFSMLMGTKSLSDSRLHVTLITVDTVRVYSNTTVENQNNCNRVRPIM